MEVYLPYSWQQKFTLHFHFDSRYYFQSSGCYPFSLLDKGCLMFDPKKERRADPLVCFLIVIFFPFWFTQSQFLFVFVFKGTGSYSFQDTTSASRPRVLLQKANYCRLFFFHYSWFVFGLMTLSWHMEPAEVTPG